MDVLFRSTYDQMGLPLAVFKLVDKLLYGFSGHNVRPYGGVELLVTIRSHLTQAIVMNNFLIVDTPEVYNAIVRRPMQAVAFTHHLTLKFSTPARIGVIWGSQVEAHCYYALVLKGKSYEHQEANIISSATGSYGHPSGSPYDWKRTRQQQESDEPHNMIAGRG